MFPSERRLYSVAWSRSAFGDLVSLTLLLVPVFFLTAFFALGLPCNAQTIQGVVVPGSPQNVYQPETRYQPNVRSDFQTVSSLNAPRGADRNGLNQVGGVTPDSRRYKYYVPQSDFNSGEESLMTDELAEQSLRTDQTPHYVSRPAVTNYNDSASRSGANEYSREYGQGSLLNSSAIYSARESHVANSVLNDVTNESAHSVDVAKTFHASASIQGNSASDSSVLTSVPATFWMDALLKDPYHRFHGVMDEREALMILDGKDGTFQNYSLLNASLIAGGTVQNNQLDRYQIQFQDCVARIRQQMPVQASPLVKAQVILEFMHRELFRKYLLESSSLSALFDDGIYNCVTGVVLFNSFARQFGLNVSALELPGHAMTRLNLGGSHYDVETTCEIWFKLENMPGKQEQVISRMLQAGVAAQAPDAPIVRREINDVELVAKLYYNRGVDQLSRKDYSLALQCNAKALSLDPDSFTARGNFLATINNWAIAESKEGNYSQAMSLLRQGIQMDPNYPIFRNNHVHIYHQWIEMKCKQLRYDEALALARQAISEAPTEDHFKKLEAYALMALNQQQNLTPHASAAMEPAQTSTPASESVSTSVAYPH